MASQYEYFVKDAQNLISHHTMSMMSAEGVKLGEFIARLHLDFEANAKYISLYFPEMPGVACPEALALNKVGEILTWPETQVGVQMGMGQEMRDAQQLIFTGQIYLYSERPIPEAFKARLFAEAVAQRHSLTFRSVQYVEDRDKWEKPRAFISHDSRDAASIAEPLAVQLLTIGCPVWFDKYSLRVGDSLRESIERGLKECHKCILVLTPTFLSNKGWSKREYDSVFTRELIEHTSHLA